MAHDLFILSARCSALVVSLLRNGRSPGSPLRLITPNDIDGSSHAARKYAHARAALVLLTSLNRTT